MILFKTSGNIGSNIYIEIGYNAGTPLSFVLKKIKDWAISREVINLGYTIKFITLQRLHANILDIHNCILMQDEDIV